MAIRPKKLLIPGKYNFSPQRYLSDMQTLEIFNPINKLVAGANVTLDPANGSGPQVKISTTGGGGGGNAPAAFADTIAGPEGNQSSALTNGQWFPFTPTIDGSFCVQGIPLFQSAGSGTGPGGGGANDPEFAQTWFTILAAGQSANILPVIETPPFTGGTGFLIWQFFFWAVSIDYANGYIAQTNHLSRPTFDSYQIATTDLQAPFIHFGTDLTLTAGSGDTGNGLVSGGAGKPYLAGISGAIQIPPGTTF